MVGLEQLGGPGDTDGAHGRILLQTRLLKGEGLQLHQSDVVFITAGVKPADVPALACAGACGGATAGLDFHYLGWMKMSLTGTISVVF